MPIYEYTCEACKTKFERLIKSISSTDPIRCPKCESKKTTRSMSVFAVASTSGKSDDSAPGMCGRCGGPGPCGMN